MRMLHSTACNTAARLPHPHARWQSPTIPVGCPRHRDQISRQSLPNWGASDLPTNAVELINARDHFPREATPMTCPCLTTRSHDPGVNRNARWSGGGPPSTPSQAGS